MKEETRWFTESDLEPLTKDQLIHVIISGALGFDGMERNRKHQRESNEKDYDGCVDCRSIASRLGLHEPV